MKKELWLIWKQPKTRRRYKIGVLSYDGNKYKFNYSNPELDDALKEGFEYFPGFTDIKKYYESDELFSNIKTRLPNKKRPDYLEILNTYNLASNADDFDILTSTKGRLLTDSYEFVQVFDVNKIEFDVAGIRHSDDVIKYKGNISVNDKLYLELEPDNPKDIYAIKVLLNKNNESVHLGYVPRYYSKELTELLKNNITYSALIKSVKLDSEIKDENISASVKIIFNSK